MGPPPGRDDGAGQVLGRRLPVRTRDRDDRALERAPVDRREVEQRLARVTDVTRQAPSTANPDRTMTAAAPRSSASAMKSCPSSRSPTKRRTGCRVGPHAESVATPPIVVVGARRAPRHRPPQRPRRGSSARIRSRSAGRAPRARPRDRRTARARRRPPAWSRGPCRRPPRRLRTGLVDRALGSPSAGPARRRTRPPLGRCPLDRRSMIASGSSDRGLSLVTITRSASSAAARPIIGRFARSRSPPQPNTTITRPSADARAPRSTLWMLSGVCA